MLESQFIQVPKTQSFREGHAPQEKKSEIIDPQIAGNALKL